MKYLFAALLLLPALLQAQISFNTPAAPDPAFAAADSAIRAGEFGEVHSLLVIRSGQLVFEKYYNGWSSDSLHQLQSATKSVVATLFGCALQAGFLKNAAEPIARFFPESDFSDARKRSIRIEDLMTQRHGLKWKENPWDAPDNTWRRVQETPGNWFGLILETPMDTLPGAFFNYSNAAPVLTAGIVQRASGMNIDAFAKQHLFEPLHIERWRFWGGNGGPQHNGMALLWLCSRDMAKIGQLYLQNGLWAGRQILPANFVREATAARVSGVEPNGVYSAYDYGFFWWSNPVWRAAPKGWIAPRCFLARGAGGQNIIVVPEKNTVIVITAWNLQRSNKPQEIYERYLAPVLNGWH